MIFFPEEYIVGNCWVNIFFEKLSQFNGESHLSELFPLLAHYTRAAIQYKKFWRRQYIFSKIWSQEITLKNCIVYIVVSTISSEKTQLFPMYSKVFRDLRLLWRSFNCSWPICNYCNYCISITIKNAMNVGLSLQCSKSIIY